MKLIKTRAKKKRKKENTHLKAKMELSVMDAMPKEKWKKAVPPSCTIS
jgi:hypothetical protein